MDKYGARAPIDVDYTEVMQELFRQPAELKTYTEWCEVFQREEKLTIHDNDGLRALHREGSVDEKLTREEAYKYFIQRTVVGYAGVWK